MKLVSNIVSSIIAVQRATLLPVVIWWCRPEVGQDAV
jgi:hypothetical protein